MTGAVFKLTAHRLMDWPALTLVGLNARLALVAGWDISMARAGDNPDDKASRPPTRSIAGPLIQPRLVSMVEEAPELGVALELAGEGRALLDVPHGR